MTIKELIEKLSQYDETLPVKLEYDGSYYEVLSIQQMTEDGETFIGID